MNNMVWVFRCSEGCTGIAASVVKSSVMQVRGLHYKTHMHKGTISLEDRELIEQECNPDSNTLDGSSNVEELEK